MSRIKNHRNRYNEIENEYCESDFNERLEKAKSAPILQVASLTGYKLVKRGSCYTFAEHDSVVIDVKRNHFWHNSQCVNGDCVKLLQHFNNLSFKDALNTVLRLCGEDEVPVYMRDSIDDGGEKRFFLPSLAEDRMGGVYTKNIEKYLTEERCLSENVVKYLITTGRLRQQSIRAKNNTRGKFRSCCLFIGYASGKAIGKPTFCERRAIHPNEKGKKTLTVPGSDWKHGFYINNNRETLVITEGILDCMAIMTILERNKYNFTGCDYLALIGASKVSVLANILNEQPHIKNVILSLDNDEGGRKSLEAAKTLLDKNFPNIRYKVKVPKNYKDYNDKLVSEKSNSKNK